LLQTWANNKNVTAKKSPKTMVILKVSGINRILLKTRTKVTKIQLTPISDHVHKSNGDKYVSKLPEDDGNRVMIANLNLENSTV
jgi:hypothetical protein